MNTVTYSGPLFGPNVGTAVEAGVRQIREDITQETERRIHANLKARLRNPTGYYQSQIRTTNLTLSSDLIDDSRVVYGPWLEGVSRRNQETRFKGYASFRIATQTMQARAVAIAEDGVDRIVRGLS